MAMTPHDIVSPQAFKDAMSRLGAAVNVITTAGPGGTCGFTASAVCSVSADTPSLLVCMNKRSTQTTAFRKNRVLCVNTLAADQKELSQIFAGVGGHAMRDRFAQADWDILASGAPVLRGSLVSFDCRVERIVTCGSHNVFFCHVVAVNTVAAPCALMYFQRSYHALGAAA
jgi:flavin reductase